MPWYAGLHVHSRFASATSRALTLLALADGARVKGLSVLGTGDVTSSG
jgi:PHP family Zn ribbon phosphoesterase